MPEAAADVLETLGGWREANEHAVLRELCAFLSLRNVAGEARALRENAAWVRTALEKRGVVSELWHAPGDADAAPAVYGRLDVGAAWTVGIYAHYDGQPADEAHWTVGPWTPALFTDRVDRGGVRRGLPAAGEVVGDDCRLYGRSAADDKAPVVALLAALDALRDGGVSPAVNVVVFVEGEEETTSPHLSAHIAGHVEEMSRPDVWLFCDGPADTFGRHHVAFGVRGDVELELAVWGPVHELHSGHFGNFAVNPAIELARLLGSMKGAHGRVLIEGFEDGADAYSAAELDAVREAEGLDAALVETCELAGVEGGAAAGTYFERMLRPSLNVRGLEAAGVGAEARNVVPSVARASLDIRSVRGSDPAGLVELLREHARRLGFTVIDREPTWEERRRVPRLLSVTELESYPAVRTDMDDPAACWALGAVERGLGERVLRVPTLGSSMPMHAFAAGVGRPVVITPMANADNNQHAADENIRVGHFWRGVGMLAGVLTSEGPRVS